jgi:hypothetical protein
MTLETDLGPTGPRVVVLAMAVAYPQLRPAP